MNTGNFVENERRRLQKIVNFRLPHEFMAIGIGITLLSVIMIFVRAFAMNGDTEWLKLLLQKNNVYWDVNNIFV
jgi:hypothetical protein